MHDDVCSSFTGLFSCTYSTNLFCYCSVGGGGCPVPTILFSVEPSQLKRTHSLQIFTLKLYRTISTHMSTIPRDI